MFPEHSSTIYFTFIRFILNELFVICYISITYNWMCEISREEWLTEEGSVKRVKREHLGQKKQKDDESIGSFNPLWTKRGYGIAQAVLHVVASHDGTAKQQSSEGGRTGSWGNSNPKDNTFVLPLLIIFRKGLLIALKKLTPFKSQGYKILGECISIRKWRI